jgi:hypothetical protein
MRRPPAPTGLTAAAGVSSNSLSWTPRAGAIYYNVKWAATLGGPYRTIARGLTNTAYTSIGLAAATNFYVVTAWAMGGESTDSLPVTAIANN